MIAKSLGYDCQAAPSTMTDLKKAYVKIILPFEIYVEKLKISGINISASPSSYSASSSPTIGMASRMMGGSAKNDTPITFTQVQEASAKLNEALHIDGTFFCCSAISSGLRTV